jgi:hypothetical protein
MNDNFNNYSYIEGGTWHRVADRTTGNETGRFMLVNGYDPGAVFFKTEVEVKANTLYFFSAWILNVYKIKPSPDLPPIALPEFGVRVSGEDGEVIFEESLGEKIPTRTFIPEWRQIGTDIFIANHEKITIEFISEGEAAYGNDYAVDDVQLREIEIPEIPERCHAITDVIQSAALQEAAIAHILNAEGEKIQEIVAMFKAGKATLEDVTAVNKSAEMLIESVNILETVIRTKLKLLEDGMIECRKYLS